MFKTCLDMLNQDSVSVKKQQYVVIDGKEFLIGEPWRKAYINSAQGRIDMQNEVEDPYQTAILSIWGKAPTI